MAKVFLPLLSASAAGKLGPCEGNFVYQRTCRSGDDPLKQVTYVKMRVVPANPDTIYQQASRELFSMIMKAGKALKDAVKKG